jgi:hypothetical protein
MLKREAVLLGDFHQTFYPPLHRFDPLLMRELEPRKSQPDYILGTVGLGLLCSCAVGGGKAPETVVMLKALVATARLYE